MNITKTYPGDASILNNAGIDPTLAKAAHVPTAVVVTDSRCLQTVDTTAVAAAVVMLLT